MFYYSLKQEDFEISGKTVKGTKVLVESKDFFDKNKRLQYPYDDYDYCPAIIDLQDEMDDVDSDLANEIFFGPKPIYSQDSKDESNTCHYPIFHREPISFEPSDPEEVAEEMKAMGGIRSPEFDTFAEKYFNNEVDDYIYYFSISEHGDVFVCEKTYRDENDCHYEGSVFTRKLWKTMEKLGFDGIGGAEWWFYSVNKESADVIRQKLVDTGMFVEFTDGDLIVDDE